MFRAAPEEMEHAGVKPMGSYDKLNQHGGEIWGWKKECKLTDPKVKLILNSCISSGILTIDELHMVRKALSFAYLLVKNIPKRNWPCVEYVWEIIGKGEKLAPKKRVMLPEIIGRPKDLRRAFTRGWRPEHPWSLLKFAAGVVAAYDCLIWGGRAGEKGDISRIKKSRTHYWNFKDGYMWTTLEGGRCKLPNEIRDWKIYTICMCDSPSHRRPPANFYKYIDRDGNPVAPVTFCTTCPMACLELKWQWDKAKLTRYSKATKIGTFGAQNDWDVMKVAVDWMMAQGVTEERYSHNSGRKLLAKWLEKVGASYPEGYELHQDLEGNWRVYYQQELAVNPVKFERRTQSLNPDTCCCALRKLAMYFGVGGQEEKLPLEPPLERYLHGILSRTDRRRAKRIRCGKPDESSSDSEPALTPIDWTFWKPLIKTETGLNIPPPLPPLEDPLYGTPVRSWQASVVKPVRRPTDMITLGARLQQLKRSGKGKKRKRGQWHQAASGELLIEF